MTAPAPADPFGEQPQPPDEGLSPTEQAVLTALALWFASSAAVAAASLPAALTARLVAFGLDPRAVRAAGRIVMAPPLTGRRRYGSPRVSPGATVARQVGADEPGMRARYLLAAARRLTTAAAQGVFGPALRMERRYLDAHVDAGRNRARAAARLDQTAAEHGPWLVWRTQRDASVEAECAELEGTVFTVDNLPKGHIPGAVHPHCLLPGNLVCAPGLRATTMRWYSGEVVELLTDRGDNLTVTPNHPVLTPEGWVPAGLLDEGRQVVRTDFAEALLRLVDPDNYQAPALIEDVVASFSKRGGVLPVAVPVAAEDFHGDGAGSEIAVVRADRMLGHRFDASQAQPRCVQQFSGDGGRSPMAALGRGAPLLPGVRHAAHGGVGSLGVAAVLLRRPGAHHESVGVGLAAPGDAPGAQHLADDRPRNAVDASQLVLAHSSFVGSADVARREIRAEHAGHLSAVAREIVGGGLIPIGPAGLQVLDQRVNAYIELAGSRDDPSVASLIELDRLQKVRRYGRWSGHVYNLETTVGWYVSGNILTHNCRCYATGLTDLHGAQPTVHA